MTRAVIPVVLSGGSGTRLWPLSRPDRPKQFQRLVTEHSLFQDAVLRTHGLDAELKPPIVICNEAHRYLVAEQLRELGLSASAIVLEPEGRNTAPAVAIAALLAREMADAGEDPILLVLPADHVISAREAFVTAVEAAIEAAEDSNLVTFGVVPDRPETGYGYIRRGMPTGKWFAVEAFVEKPDRDTAEAYVSSGDYFWNSGMFVFSATALLDELDRHAQSIAESCRAALDDAEVGPDFTRLGDAFASCPSDSIDYAVMEHTDRAAVVALEAGWSDVGSWAALHAMLGKDGEGNVLRGDVIAMGCSNSYVAAEGRVVAAIGLAGIVVVETADAVLVASLDECQSVKSVVDDLASRDSS